MFIGVALFVLVGVSFAAGAAVGYRKARFSYAWGENYDRNFGGPHHGILGIFSRPDILSAHGTFGSILRVATGTIAVSGNDGAEKIIAISSSTVIRDHFDAVQESDLTIGDTVVVIGAPDSQGQIDARLIRVLQDKQ